MKIEWMTLFFLSGYIAPKCMYVYDKSGEVGAAGGTVVQPIMYLVGTVVFTLIYLVAAAKCNFFNVFKIIRVIPKELKKIWKMSLLTKP